MRKIGILSFCLLSCLINTSFADNPKHVHHRNGSAVLDLRSMIKNNMSLAVKDPTTGAILYTHDGMFLKHDGYFYQGTWRLQGYPVPTALTSNDCQLTDIKAPDEVRAAVATTLVTPTDFNLSSNDPVVAVTPFKPSDSRSFNYTIATTIYDSLGKQHMLQLYFVKTHYNDWDVQVSVDSNIVGGGHATFGSNGELISATGLTDLIFPPTANSKQTFSISLTGATQYGEADQTLPWQSNGNPVGYFVEERVDQNGYISDVFDDGSSVMFSKIAVFNR